MSSSESFPFLDNLLQKGPPVCITLNGQPKEFKDTLSLKKIVETFCKNPQHVIAEVNGTIIKNTEWDNQRLNEGDVVELVSFVGGG